MEQLSKSGRPWKQRLNPMAKEGNDFIEVNNVVDGTGEAEEEHAAPEEDVNDMEEKNEYTFRFKNEWILWTLSILAFYPTSDSRVLNRKLFPIKERKVTAM